MKISTRVKIAFSALAASLLLTGCGIQSIPQAKNQVDAAMSEVTNQYKRRADLIPNLVATVKGYAKHEEKVLTEVTDARARATAVMIDPSHATPAQIAKYQQSQGELSAALGRLMSVSERYPNLKADEQFRELQAQLEGTENRITIARQRLIKSIQDFNNQITVPPESWTNSMFYHYKEMAQWDVPAAEKSTIQQAPKVNF